MVGCPSTRRKAMGINETGLSGTSSKGYGAPLRKAALVAAWLVLLLLASCAATRAVKLEPFSDIQAIKGQYTLIIYGGNYTNDPETAAFLDKEGDGYELVPYAPSFDYRVVKGLSVAESFRLAETVFDGNTSYLRTYVKRIVVAGETVGYELRPYYMPLRYGYSDILNIDYALEKGGRIRVYVRLRSELLWPRRDNGESSIFGR
jgi:hypothetical protein